MPINLHSLANAVRMSFRVLQKIRSGAEGSTAPAAPRPDGRAPGARPVPSAAYPGDFRGVSAIRYNPRPDGSPDPGEIVWTWVPYEEDHTQGKDRPVLLVGSNGPLLLGLMLTSRDRDQHGDGSADYVEIGTGSWDRHRRPSEANVGRILQISPQNIRREGAVLAKDRFDLVADALRRRHGWK